MNKLRLLTVATPALLVLTIDLPSRSSGIYQNGITRGAPACGQCHRPTPGAAAGFAPVVVTVDPTARVLAPAQATNVNVSVAGGFGSARGGFACDATAGIFSAGLNTALAAGGTAITHSNSSARTWSFGYTAPSTPGLVELYTVGNAVNGNNNNDNNDMWAFAGFDQAASTATPTRLYVNAPGVTAFGSACAGGFGNVPVFGARQAPTVGNAAFALELHGAAPNATVGVILGVTAFPVPIDLGFVGVPGCALAVDPLLVLNAVTGAGNAQRGEGTATIAMPIPARPILRNRTLRFQAFFTDVASGRPTPLTFTNGLAVTLQ
ncbi:MAG: choice-of-anchor V domain-containing protein [Planctomycetota bacterium]